MPKWTEGDEALFQTLIKKYQDNPKQQPTKEDSATIEHLMECYLDAETSGAGLPIYEVEGKLYRKICDFFNIFLEAHFVAHPEALSNKEQLQKSRSTSPIATEMPMVNMLSTFTNKYIRIFGGLAHEEFIAARAAFMVPPLCDLVSKKELCVFDQNSVLTFPYIPSNPKVDDIYSLPFEERINQIYTRAQERHGSELNLEKQRDELIQKNYQNWRVRTLSGLEELYHLRDASALVHIPYIFDGNGNLYSFPASKDILPHPVLSAQLLKLSFSTFYPGSKSKLAPLLGKLLTEPDYRVLPKSDGKDPGFILVAPDGKRTYAKQTENMIPELFCSKALSYIGIKMPEARLLEDNYGNCFYLTSDASRQYTKQLENGETFTKDKQFITFQYLFARAPKSAFGFSTKKDNLIPDEEQEALVNGFIKGFSESVQLKTSYAKLLLTAVAFGLSDYGGHGGNVGVITTNKNDVHYQKFGIIDFQFAVTDLSKNSELATNPLEFIRKHMQARSVMPIFIKLFNALKPEDFLRAVIDLTNPKVRLYSFNDCFLLSQSKVRDDAASQIYRASRQVILGLDNLRLSSKERGETHAQLLNQQALMIDNLAALHGSLTKKYGMPDADVAPASAGTTSVTAPISASVRAVPLATFAPASAGATPPASSVPVSTSVTTPSERLNRLIQFRDAIVTTKWNRKVDYGFFSTRAESAIRMQNGIELFLPIPVANLLDLLEESFERIGERSAVKSLELIIATEKNLETCARAALVSSKADLDGDAIKCYQQILSQFEEGAVVIPPSTTLTARGF